MQQNKEEKFAELFRRGLLTSAVVQFPTSACNFIGLNYCVLHDLSCYM